MTGSHSFCFIVSARYENSPKPANTFGRAYHNPFENHQLREYNNYTPRAVSFVQPEEYGRFQIETNDSHAFILDSATGQVWSSIFLGNLFGPDPNFHAVKALPLPRSF